MLSDHLPTDPAALPNRAWHLEGPALSWGAIFAGAVGAAALSLILLILGTGLGLSAVSPWAQAGIGATAFGVSTIAWITFTQLAASGLGGYLAGRLRRKWSGVHGDETFFRDTAHGFLSWAVATIVTAAFLGSAISGVVAGGTQAAAKVAGVAAATAAAAGGAEMASRRGVDLVGTESGTSYFVDTLFRRDMTPVPGTPAATPLWSPAGEAAGGARTSNVEVMRIFSRSLAEGTALPPDDLKYVAQLVAQRTGISQADAEARVGTLYGKAQAAAKDVETKARAAADEARKATAYASLWLFISLLIGAFVASLLATFGGKLRDQ